MPNQPICSLSEVEQQSNKCRPLQSIFDSSIIIASITDYDTIIQQTILQLPKIIHDVDAASIQIVVKNQIEIAAVHGRSSKWNVVGARYLLSKDNPWSDVIKYQKPVQINDTISKIVAPYQPSRIQSWLSVPMIGRQSVIGALTVETGNPNHYNDMDVRRLMLFAKQVAVAIENVRMFEQQQLQFAHTLQVISTIQCSQLDRGGIVDRLFDLLAEVVQYDHVCVQLRNKEGKIDFRADRGFADSEQVIDYSNWLDKETLDDLINGCGVVSISDTRIDERWVPVQDSEAISSYIGASLVVNGEVIGVLHVGSAVPYMFTQDTERHIELFAYQAATTIDNNRLRDIARRATERRVEAERSYKETYTKLNQIDSILTQEITSRREVESRLAIILMETKCLRAISQILAGSLTVNDSLIHEVLNVLNDSGVIEPAIGAILLSIEARTDKTFVGAGIVGQYFVQTAPTFLKSSRSPNIAVNEIKHLFPSTQEPTYFDDLAKTATHSQMNFEDDTDNDNDIQACVTIPLTIAGHWIGAFLLFWDSPLEFTDGKRQFLWELQAQLTTILENHQLDEQTKRALTETQILYEANRVLVSANDVDEALQETLRLLRLLQSPRESNRLVGTYATRMENTNPTRFSVIRSYHDDGSTTDLRHGDTFVFELEQFKQLLSANTSETIFITEQNVLSRLIAKSREVLSRAFRKTCVITPITIDGRWVGLLTIAWEQPHRFSDLETRLFRSVMGQISVFIERFHRVEAIRLSEETFRQTTNQLMEVNRELEAFSYSISHDLRAPLRSIDWFSKKLDGDPTSSLSPEGSRALNKVLENAEHMNRLIDDLLAFSRTGRQVIDKRFNNVTELIHDILEDFYSDITQREIEVAVGDLPPCMADTGMIRLVFQNLLENAFKFTRLVSPAQIEIGTIIVDGKVAYYVKDNGVGFSMQYADKLFNVFQRLHHADEFEGTGVGLAIVQRIIHRHDGHIWFQSARNKGTTFFFTLEGNQSSEYAND